MSARRSARGRRQSAHPATRLFGLLVLALLLGLTAWSVAALQPPDPQPITAPAAEFSAGRAFEHVQQIAAEAHVAGSAANDRRVKALTLTPAGVALRNQVMAVMSEPPDAIAALPPADQRALRDILARAVEQLRASAA